MPEPYSVCLQASHDAAAFMSTFVLCNIAEESSALPETNRLQFTTLIGDKFYFEEDSVSFERC